MVMEPKIVVLFLVLVKDARCLYKVRSRRKPILAYLALDFQNHDLEVSHIFIESTKIHTLSEAYEATRHHNT